jgi:hypothetical protein
MGWLWIGGLAALAVLVALAALWDRRSRRRHRLRSAGDMVGCVREAGDFYLESPERFPKAPAQ